MNLQVVLNPPRQKHKSNLNFDPVKVSAVNHSRLTIIKSLLDGYDGSTPFHLYLKACFVKHKNFGSRDRRIYSSWCYAYLRLGKALPKQDFNTRLAVAWYLVHGDQDEIFKTLNNGMIAETALPTIAERIRFIAEIFSDFNVNDIFPFALPLSGNISGSDYAESMLTQPRVWIRIKEGKVATVIDDLEANGIPFEKDEENSGMLSFNSGVKLEVLNSKQKGFFEIQDRSSQLAGAAIPAKKGEHWWDCCCGAGGKSLEVFDKVPGVKITATDSRAAILKNYRERTQTYHSQLSTTLLDLEQPVSPGFFGSKFDGIIADVPCSGSGTWSRTPEYLRFFDAETIANYVKRQQTIIAATIPFLKTGGTLIYITCSVFKAENEDMAEWISSLSGMKLESQKHINGTSVLADSMFCGIFVKL